MNFKEMVEEDTDVFLNLEEFAERLNVEGIEVTCNFDDDKFAKVNKNFGNFITNKKLILSKKDYEQINSPKFDSEILVVNKVYRITNLKINFGTVELSLSGGDS